MSSTMTARIVTVVGSGSPETRPCHKDSQASSKNKGAELSGRELCMFAQKAILEDMVEILLGVGDVSLFVLKMSDIRGSTYSITDSRALHKELDEALCPICMDHPHNAVLLLCSAHEKGCRSFICDTSYRHSNCLDRFKKLSVNCRNSPSRQNTSPSGSTESLRIGRFPIAGSSVTYDLSEVQGTLDNQDLHDHSEYQHGNVVQISGTSSGQGISPAGNTSAVQSLQDASLNLTCPLCRGAILGLKVEKEARQYLDLKQRSCSHESCSFTGNYQELRRHARSAHPTKCPADIDPSRVRIWQNLERQRDYDDIMSVIRLSMPNALVFGDYVVDNGNDGNDATGDAPWWSTRLLFEINRNHSRRDLPQHRRRSRLWTRQRRISRDFSSRMHQWGESFSRPRVVEDNWNRSSRRSQDPSPRPHRRRRFSNSRPEENQQ
ncbi:unnamed protein product [Rhodiola kirilowii]